MMGPVPTHRSHAPWLGPAPEQDIDNVLRATPRKLCFSIWGVPPESGTYSRREPCSLMYGVPPLHSMLEEDYRYPRNALGT
jgi:hypothetical protein